jgi:hypothetical protein
MQKHLFFTLITLFLAQISWGQFSTDPSENTIISDAGGEQALPKIAVASDGSMYITWFSSEGGNYNVRMQYLDKNGTAQWQPNGILVSDNQQESSLTNYSLTVDPENHAVVTFQDIRTGSNNPVGYRISPSGDFIWGEDGILLSNNANFEPVPAVCATDEGNMVFAWQSIGGATSEVRLQKVSGDGTTLWGEGIILSETGVNYAHPYLLPTDGDNVFLIWHKETGPFFAPNRGLFVQKLDANGAFIWSEAVEIYAPAPSGPVHYLDLTTDDSGGVIFTWYGNDVGTHFNSWVQHMTASGALSFSANGVVVSTTMLRNHMYPSSAFLPQTQEIITYFSEQDLNQNQRGLYAQKFNLQGERQWGEEGKVLIPLSNSDYSLPKASGYEDKAICIFGASVPDNPVASEVWAVMLDTNGDYVWQDNFITMSSVPSQKLHRVISGYSSGQWVAVWGDERGSSRDIYAQNISTTGALGPVAAADGKIQGFVRDAITNKAISSATIYLTNTDNGFQTNATPFGSHYSIQIPAGTYDLECESDGYQTLELSNITINEGLNTQVNLYLLPTDEITGVSQSLEDTFSVSPNPFTKQIVFNFSAVSNFQKIEILNASGQVIEKIDPATAAHPTIMDTSHWPTGIYFYSIITTQKSFSGKLIKQ